ncbi:MAG: 3-deoxy-7-phosphoheptulonate synthase [Planctomycetes bacterium]|nr:3-deoxy-7-phosphoheptulonate synthase [Planctomycetota bacterium]
MELTDNLNIKQFKPLITPEELKKKFPQSEQAANFILQSRKAIQDILTNKDKRRMVITGPCSLHDNEAALEYAQRLKKLQEKVAGKLLLIMRTYFEKPRTTIGWKGMLYDPRLDNSDDIEEGFHKARKILIEIADIHLPAATELLDPITPQYLADMISWAAIGARTTESQIHRQMASGLSMPIGFKNATDGSIDGAVDAIKSASNAHSFMGINRLGQVIIAETTGNKFGHLVMRGGNSGPNYAAEYIAFAKILLKKTGVTNGIVIDCSHANSNKDHKQQRYVLTDIEEQIKDGDKSIAGVMLESFLCEGHQNLSEPKNLKYGISVTDKCIGWEETEELICRLAGVI